VPRIALRRPSLNLIDMKPIPPLTTPEVMPQLVGEHPVSDRDAVIATGPLLPTHPQGGRGVAEQFTGLPEPLSGLIRSAGSDSDKPRPRRSSSILRYVPPPLRESGKAAVLNTSENLDAPPQPNTSDAASRNTNTSYLRDSTLAAHELAEMEAAEKQIQSLVGKLAKTAHIDTDVCHWAARVVSFELCGMEGRLWLDSNFKTLEQALRKPHSPKQKTVYTVGLDSIGHTLSILRVGDKAVILQSWLGSYTLADWIKGTKKTIAGNPWLPTKGGHDVKEIAYNLAKISDLLLHADDPAVFNAIGKLFSPHPRQFRAVAPCIEKTKSRQKGLLVKWSRMCTSDSALEAGKSPPLERSAAELLDKLQLGASEWICDTAGNSPLLRFLAQERDETQILRLIEMLPKEYLEQANAEGDTALHHATAKRSIPLMTVLTKKRCSWQEFNAQGESPVASLLHRKAWLQMTTDDVSAIVIQGGANLDAKETNKSHGLLMRLVDHCHDAALISRLIEAGADVNIQDELDSTPLMWAAGSGNATAVNALITHGADVKLTDKSGDNAHNYATSSGNYLIAQQLAQS
jgi:ankyrin repeat protein